MCSSDLDARGKTTDEIVSLAIAQTLARPVETTPYGAFTKVRADPFASARLLDPTTVLGPSPSGGYLVAIPSVDGFLAVPVDRALTVTRIRMLTTKTLDDFSNLDNPASSDLYWWRDGVLEVIRPQGDQIELPPELQALISPD